MYEVLHHYRSRIEASQVLVDLALDPGGYFLVSAHREENIEDERQFGRLVEMLQKLAGEFGLPVVLTTHPRTRARLEGSGASLPAEVLVLKPFRFSDYVHLEMHARAVLSDSGTISEEASILNLRALNIRQAHERPEAMEEASVMLTGFDWSRIAEALRILEVQPSGDDRLLRPVADYQAPHVSEKVVRLIVSYTDYVRRTVWGVQ
jgi:UDP-N-acetylglucosamine 2-epimerase (non-hydrolysing)